jgi:hypothetical protein
MSGLTNGMLPGSMGRFVHHRKPLTADMKKLHL